MLAIQLTREKMYTMTTGEPYRLELEPTTITGHEYDTNTLEIDVTKEFAGYLRATLGDMIVRPGFDPAEVTPAFVATIEEKTPTIIPNLVHEQWEWDIHGYKSVMNKVGELMAQGTIVDATDVVPSAGYCSDLVRQAKEMPSDFFAPLQQYNQILSRNKSLSLIDAIHQLTKDQEAGWLDTAYELAKQAIHDPEYVPDLSAPEALYLIPFVPGHARQLTRRVLVGNYMAAHIAHQLGDMTGEERETVEVYKAYTAADALSGQHWSDKAKYAGFSNEHEVEMGLATAAQLQALAAIQRLVGGGHGQPFIEAWNTTKELLKDTMESLSSYTNPLSEWESQDIGHCFKGFEDYQLYRIFNPSGLKEHDYNPADKTGGKVVVLEDDDQQRAVWLQTLDHHSGYKTAEETTFTEPQGIEDYIDDPEVGMFLLDIQNGRDETAGIKVAEAVIRQKIAAIHASANPDKMLRTNVIVWSSSQAAVTAAHEHLESLVKELKADNGTADYIGYMGLGSGTSSTRYRLMVHVRQKALRLSDLEANSW